MYVSQDFVLNGVGHGDVGGMMADLHYDPGLLRPFFDDKNRSCVLVNAGRKNGKPQYEKRLVSDLVMNQGLTKLVQNTTALTKEQWITLSNRVVQASRERLRAWSDLMAASSYGGFDGMSTMALEYQTMSDAGEAVMDFDAMTEGRNDVPIAALEGLPLPITHSDFFFSERLLAISRRNGTPLNTRMGEMAARRVGEKVEDTLIGFSSGAIQLGGSAAAGFSGLPYGRAPKVYGYTNFPSRITKTDMTTPTGSNPEATVQDVLEILELLRAQNFYGPFMVYTSTDWDIFLDNDYARLGGSNANMTLRERLRKIEGIADVRRLDRLRSATHPFTMLVVQMTSEVVQAINGMDITTIQWPSMGGMRVNFKVMCIMVPLLTADYTGKCGLVQATVS